MKRYAVSPYLRSLWGWWGSYIHPLNCSMNIVITLSMARITRSNSCETSAVHLPPGIVTPFIISRSEFPHDLANGFKRVQV